MYKVQVQFFRISNNLLESIDSAFLFFGESLHQLYLFSYEGKKII